MANKKFFLITALLIVATASIAFAQPPTFSKAFTPSTIGIGSTSSLEFSIANGSGVGVRSLAFSDTFPAGMTIADPSSVLSSCGGTVSTPAGGGTISLTGGEVGAGGSCSVSLNVTSATPGTHSNVSGDLTSDAGNSGTASADLTVASDLPGFSKSFSPNVVAFGARSTLTFLIDNAANAGGAVSLSFTDNLPPNMTVANPANASSTCGGGVLTAAAGTSVITYSPAFQGDATVAAGASCTVVVDVTANASGVLNNVSGDLTSLLAPGSQPILNSGFATDQVQVASNLIALTKTFTDDPTAPGGTVTLEFEVRNLSRGSTATDIAFTDDLGAALFGLEATGLPVNGICGAGSQFSGTGVVSLTAGELPAGGTCVFSATLAVPAGAAPGTYTNTTSAISATVDGNPTVGAAATDLLFIAPTLTLTKTFLDNPVGSGETVELEFTITNPHSTETATDITFEDVFDDVLPTASVVPANGFCGAGSVASYTPLIVSTSTTPAKLVVTGAELAAGASCTFSLTLDLDGLAPAGTYLNTTSDISGVINGEAVAGDPASDELDVVAPPVVIKEFIDDPVAAGGTVTLQFTVTYDLDGDGVIDLDVSHAADGITFTDNLEAVAAGLAPAGVLPTDPCGAGSSLDFSSGVLTLMDGFLDPGAGNPIFSCQFSVDLVVPAGTPSGNYPNTTSNVVATVGGVATSGNSASDDLRVAGLMLTKEFTDDPVVAGDTVNLRFTLTNDSVGEDATAIVFSDNLNAVISGLVAVGLPANDICGTGSQISGTNNLTFQAGNLVSGASCTFDVTLQVPAGAASDIYVNSVNVVTATMDGTPNVVFDGAIDQLVVSSNFLTLSKEFIDDPVPPGGTATLRFSINNSSTTDTVNSIAFTDDLDAVLSGLVSTSGTLNDICGLGSQISGAGVLSFIGGNLAPSSSCVFDVSLQVPNEVGVGTGFINTTSGVSGSTDSGSVSGDPASDELQISLVSFSKSFDGTAEPGDIVVLTFTIENLSTTTSSTGLAFTDDLDAMLSGASALGLPTADVCGLGSALSGTSLISLADGNLLPGGSCTFSVEVQVPAGATSGDYPNTTSALRQGPAVAADPASATLTVIESVDSDGDGVLDAFDLCPDTVIPEGVPTDHLGTNRFALVDGDGIFDTVSPGGNQFDNGGHSPKGPNASFTIEDTGGCSCEQIIEAQELGAGHTKFGCSLGEMREWIGIVNAG